MKRISSILLIIVLAVVIPVAAANAAEEAKAEHKRLYRLGARLWPTYCGQCHKARPGAEFSPGQWDTIMMHMRSRANFSGENARAMLEYLRAR